MRFLKYNVKNLSHKKSNQIEKTSTPLPSQRQNRSIFSKIDENFAFLNNLLGNAMGLVEHKYRLLNYKTEIGIIYIDSMANKEYISKQVIEPLLTAPFDAKAQHNMLSLIQSKFTYIPDTKTVTEMNQVTEELFQGNTIIFIGGIDAALVINSQKLEKRSVEKPELESTLFASMDAFTEDIETNCSLIIRRLPTPDLHFEVYSVGKLSHTKLKLLWIEGIANMKAVEEARYRIQQIDIDTVEGIGVLAELIEDQPLSIFPKYKQTQRPDITSKYLTDGCFAILCENSPYSLIAPATFWDHFKSAEEYADKISSGSYLRILRILSFIISILISPFYIAFVAYQQTVVPPALALNIASGREGVPFPSVVELLILTLIIGIIREAGLRIPSSVGFFIGVLGAVVIGQAAVTAGYFSASVIIVVAISAITSFGTSSDILVIPSRLINYFLILLSGIFGMFGLINGVAIVIWHLLRQESFGVPYMYPLVPFDPEAMKDTFIRAPFFSLKMRFEILVKTNHRRIGGQGIK